MITRRLFRTTAILLVSTLGTIPIADATDSAELKQTAQLLGLTVQEVSAIYTALAIHRNQVEAEIADHDRSQRLRWREFQRIRNHARATAKAITPQLGRRKAERALLNLHSIILPQPIRPRQRLGFLFEREKVEVKAKSRLSAIERTATYPGLPYTGHYRR